MSDSNRSWVIRNSKIQGVGVFLDRDYKSNERIDIGIYFFLGFFPIVTPFGSKINHQDNANCYLQYYNHQWHVTTRSALTKATEITLNYQDCPWYIKGKEKDYIELK